MGSADVERGISASTELENKEARQGLYCLGKLFSFLLFFYVVVFLPLMLIAVDYNEYGFKQKRSTGSVDTTKVYQSGRFFVNPDMRFKSFQATAHTVHFEDLSVFTDDKLEVLIDLTFVYFINPKTLANLHDDYEYSYRGIAEDKARAAIKNTAAKHKTPVYFENRKFVEANFTAVVKEALLEVYCELPEGTGFYLRQIRTPDEVKSKMLSQVVLNENTIQKQYEQDSQVIRQETTRMVNTINNNATRIREAAAATSVLSIKEATAVAQLLTEGARTSGLKEIYDILNLTDPTMKASLDYIRMLGAHDGADLAISFDTLFTN